MNLKTHRQKMLAAALAAPLAWATGGSAPAVAGEARLAFAGDIDRAEVSATGYCGERRRLLPEEWQHVVLPSDTPVWLFANAVFRNGKLRSVCRVERRFTPRDGEAYILRVQHVPKECHAELLQAVPGADPQPAASQRAVREPC